jgi:hypothetical protein
MKPQINEDRTVWWKCPAIPKYLLDLKFGKYTKRDTKMLDIFDI